MGVHARGSQSVDDFQHGTAEHMIDILSAVSHGISGYLAVFANTHRFSPLVLEEHELFKRMFRAATGDEWVGGDPPADYHRVTRLIGPQDHHHVAMTGRWFSL